MVEAGPISSSARDSNDKYVFISARINGLSCAKFFRDSVVKFQNSNIALSNEVIRIK